MARFTTIPDIIAHIRGKFPGKRYIGNDYTVADMINDLVEIDMHIMSHRALIQIALLPENERHRAREIAMAALNWNQVPNTAKETNDGTSSHGE